MIRKFYIKRNDTAPPLDAVLEAEEEIDLTGATVRFHMVQIDTGELKVDKAAQVVSVDGRRVRYSWEPEDTDTEGQFHGEFEVTYSDGTVRSFPNPDNILIIISPDLESENS